ncbi:hypothetical protein ALE3EI_0192 [Constantimarinum furrinae]|uniref:Uncharacterized protein n=1 Tax=Constantimarinum furrinae TaxID=2562285 RepID=A0A7G8PR16_9FLAO|nr:hypothetical protein ALE3EI_0192 [Constantimarinum furrinae]
MKNYTFQLLVITCITALLGFTGLEYPGDTFVRIIFLISFIGLLISCLDSVLISRKTRNLKLKEQRQDVRE